MKLDLSNELASGVTAELSEYTGAQTSVIGRKIFDFPNNYDDHVADMSEFSPQEDDLMIVTLANSHAGVRNSRVVTAGYTLLAETSEYNPNNGIGWTVRTYAKRLADGEDFFQVDNDNAGCVIFGLLLRSPDPDTILDVVPVEANAWGNLSFDQPAITPVSDGAYILSMLVIGSSNDTPIGDPGGYINFLEANATYGSWRPAFAMGELLWDEDDGEVDPPAFTYAGGGSGWSAHTLAITRQTSEFYATNLELQVAIRPDGELCVAPLHRFADIENQVVIKGLSPDTTYFVRAREINNVGDAGPWEVAAYRTPGPAEEYTVANITHSKAMVVVPTPVIVWHADNEVEGHPAENLGYDAPVGWRSKPGGTTHAFTAEMAAEPIDTIALLMSNLGEDATVTIKAADTLANTTAAPDFTLGPIPYRASSPLSARPGYHALVRLDSPEAHKFWRIELEGELTENLLELQHAIFGLNRSTKNHSVDRTSAPIDLGEFGRSRSGVPQRALGARMRREEFDISAMDEDDFEKHYRDLRWRVGSTEPVLIVPNSKEGQYLHDRILYGTLNPSSRHTNMRGKLHTQSFSIESLI